MAVTVNRAHARLSQLNAAAAHPTRRGALEAIADGRARTPAEVAADLGLPLGAVSYHVRALATAGLLRRAGTRQVRGAVSHHYAVTPSGRAALRAVQAWMGES